MSKPRLHQTGFFKMIDMNVLDLLKGKSMMVTTDSTPKIWNQLHRRMIGGLNPVQVTESKDKELSDFKIHWTMKTGYNVYNCGDQYEDPVIKDKEFNLFLHNWFKELLKALKSKRLKS